MDKPTAWISATIAVDKIIAMFPLEPYSISATDSTFLSTVTVAEQYIDLTTRIADWFLEHGEVNDNQTSIALCMKSIED